MSAAPAADQGPDCRRVAATGPLTSARQRQRQAIDRPSPAKRERGGGEGSVQEVAVFADERCQIQRMLAHQLFRQFRFATLQRSQTIKNLLQWINFRKDYCFNAT